MTDKNNRKAYAEDQLNLGKDCYEKGELDKVIEHWSNIKRDGDKELYAKAQLSLGFAYDKQGDLTKAIEHWSSIQREDDKELYVKAQFNLGLAYDKQGDLTKAIEYWSSIKREDYNGVYTKAQLALGMAYDKQGELTKAIECWSSIQREDDKELYAQAQFNLGLAYDKQGELTKAIEHWSNIKRDDDKRIYAQAQFNLGLAYDKQDDLDKAIEYWSSIKREDDNEAYANAQLSLGFAYDKQGDLTKAIEHWSNIKREDDKGLYVYAQIILGIFYYVKDDLAKANKYWSNIKREDNKELYAQAQYSLGQIYYIKDELNKAKKHIDEVLAQQEDNFLVAAILLEKINILQVYKGDNYIGLKQAVDEINKNTDIILESLVIKCKDRNNDPERKVATYTRVEVARKFIENKSESFHLNIANRMNDRTEGQSLFKFIGYKEDIASTESVYGFLTCFTFNHNSLNQFRLYGKTEGVEGSGVSFVISTQMFSNKHIDNNIKLNTNAFMTEIESISEIKRANALIPEIKDDNDLKNNNNRQQNSINEPIPLYRCIYMNPDNGYISIARRSRYSFFLEYGELGEKTCERKYKKYKKDMDKVEKNVEDALKSIRDSYQAINSLYNKQEFRAAVAQFIRKVLLPVCYLTKHASFEEEAECRIVYITDIANNIVRNENNRFFVTYGIPVIGKQANKNYLNKIYLGPKVEDIVKVELQHLHATRGVSAKLKIEKSNLPLA